MKKSLSVIILTFNEEINLEKCLASIVNLVSQIIIIDSYSTDKTLEIVKKYGAEIYQHKFQNQAQQFNWALDNVDIKGEWILKLDADEYLTEELKEEIASCFLPNSEFQIPNSNITGFYIKRRVYFMGKWIKHGGYYPTWFLRLWQKGKARMQDRKMDEHAALLEGETEKLKNDFVDDNKKGLRAWMGKHKNYAIREAEEVLSGNIGESKQRKFYYKMPPFLRVFIYFIYRYFFRLGFLDGWQGAIFHFLHGFWYRFLVDVKIITLPKRA